MLNVVKKMRCFTNIILCILYYITIIIIIIIIIVSCIACAFISSFKIFVKYS